MQIWSARETDNTLAKKVTAGLRTVKSTKKGEELEALIGKEKKERKYFEWNHSSAENPKDKQRKLRSKSETGPNSKKAVVNSKKAVVNSKKAVVEVKIEGSRQQTVG